MKRQQFNNIINIEKLKDLHLNKIKYLNNDVHHIRAF